MLSLGESRVLPNEGLVAVDCETTGLEDNARIIQFAAAFADCHGRIEGVYSTFLNGDGSVGSDEARAVHGFTETDIADAPTFEVAVLPIIKLLRVRLCFAHFAPFDSARINYELALVGKRGMNSMGCTKALCEATGHGLLRLQEAATKFGIDPGRPHDAGSDALTALGVLLHLGSTQREETTAYLNHLGLVWPGHENN